VIHAFRGAARNDVVRTDGTLESAYVEGVQEHHLDVHGITYGILTGLWNICIALMPQRHLAAALASAYNDWLIDEWLEVEDRLRGSITVAPQLPQSAATEIDRVGHHPSMIQVCLPASSPELPYGSEFYDPIWEACVRNDLRVALHVAGCGGLYGAANAAGWPRSYMEIRAQYPNVFEAQLISLVANGVFEKFPSLQVAFIEGGFAWVPSVMWRLDQTWRSMRFETPWLKRRPSDYIRDHVRFSTQPFEEPDDPEHILQLIDMMGSESLLMFASDFPHWDFDSPARAIPRVVGDDLRRKILWENASEFYSLPVPVPTS
jgi:predicted TIM-barrel fold metal-dependent hydrolase